MAETVANPLSQATPDPELRRMESEPKGVFQKKVKPILYLCAAALVITAALFSKTAPKPAGQQAATKQQPPQPNLQDATDNNIQDLKNQVAAPRQPGFLDPEYYCRLHPAGSAAGAAAL